MEAGKTPRTLGAALAALAALVQPLPALAQDRPCLTDREVSSIAIYGMPGLVQGVRLKCAGQLAANGYLARGGNALSARYTALQDRAWPTAKSGLLKVFVGPPEAGSPDIGVVAALPDKDVRPFVDALIIQEVQPRIATGNCGTVERVLEMMASIDPEAAGSVLGLLGGFAGLVDARTVPLCARRP